MIIFGTIDHPAAPEMHRGAFVVFNTKTKAYAYAYPTSPNATRPTRETAARMIENAYEADAETLRRAVSLLQCMKRPTGTASAFDCVGWLDIAYEMDRVDKDLILSCVNCDSDMSDALRLR